MTFPRETTVPGQSAAVRVSPYILTHGEGGMRKECKMRAAWFAALAVGSLAAACDPELPDTSGSLPPTDASASDGTGTFNAGSGTLLPDGKTIVYHIPDGTGGNDWNPKSNPIRAKRGM